MLNSYLSDSTIRVHLSPQSSIKKWSLRARWDLLMFENSTFNVEWNVLRVQRTKLRRIFSFARFLHHNRWKIHREVDWEEDSLAVVWFVGEEFVNLWGNWFDPFRVLSLWKALESTAAVFEILRISQFSKLRTLFSKNSKSPSTKPQPNFIWR